MAVSVSLGGQLSTVETLTSAVPAISSRDNSITHDGFNWSLALNADSTPPATKCAYMSPTLSSGAATLDLTALTGTQGTVDGTGLKLQAIMFNNSAANQVTISKGATNGYPLFGSTGSIVVPPGAKLLMYFYDELADVSGSAKTIDLAGTGSQSFSAALILG